MWHVFFQLKFCGMLVTWLGVESGPSRVKLPSANHWSSSEFPGCFLRLCFCCSGAQLCPTLCDPMDCSTPGLPVLHDLLELAQTHSCPLSRWCHPTISSSVVPFSSCLQSFPASGSFQKSQFFTSGGQRIGVSASASVLLVLLMNTQDWSPIDWLDLLQYQGLSRVFYSTIVQRHQFFCTQPCLWSNLHICTWLPENHS